MVTTIGNKINFLSNDDLLLANCCIVSDYGFINLNIINDHPRLTWLATLAHLKEFHHKLVNFLG